MGEWTEKLVARCGAAALVGTGYTACAVVFMSGDNADMGQLTNGSVLSASAAAMATLLQYAVVVDWTEKIDNKLDSDGRHVDVGGAAPST